MAYVNTRAAAAAGLRDRVGALIGSVQDYLRRQRVFRQTLRELDALSDRELSDLGMHRADIETIAREAAFGN